MFLEGTIIEPPTITPCSIPAEAAVSVPAALVVVLVMVDVESVMLVSDVPEPEQEKSATEKAKAVATGKICLRIKNLVSLTNRKLCKRLLKPQNLAFDRFSTV
jgi:hypothetical protein